MPAQAGFSLIEVLLGLIVLVVAAMGTLSSITSSALLGESTRELTQATIGAQRMLETLQGIEADEVFSEYNEDPNDDDLGVGTAPGAGFVITGLSPQDGDADGMVGRIVFPVNPATPGVLREDWVDASFGMPRDLDADGVIDGLDHSLGYFLLPVRVRVEWTGTSGNRFVEIDTLLVGK